MNNKAMGKIIVPILLCSMIELSGCSVEQKTGDGADIRVDLESTSVSTELTEISESDAEPKESESADESILNTEETALNASDPSDISSYVNVSFASDMSQFEDKGRELFMMSTCVVAFPSDIPVSENTVTVTNDQAVFESFLFDRYHWDNDPDDFNITVEPHKFTFNHGWYQNVSYSGQENLCYFLLESPEFDPTCFLEVDDDNARYNDDTHTLYLPILKDLPYSDYIGTTNSTFADDINANSVATYGMLALDISDYDASADNPLNLVLVIS